MSLNNRHTMRSDPTGGSEEEKQPLNGDVIKGEGQREAEEKPEEKQMNQSNSSSLEDLPTPEGDGDQGGGGQGGGGGPEVEKQMALPTPPDGGWGWVIVFASFMIHVIADGVAYSFGIFVVELLDYYTGVGRSEVGWIPSMLIGVTWGSGPIASIFVNKYGCRVVAIGGSIMGSLFLAISIASPNVYFMYFSVGIMTGLGLGLAYLPAIVSVSYYFEKRRAFATGIAVCGSGVGTFVFAPLTAFLIEMYGWQGAMLICSGLLLNCVVMGALFRPLENTVRTVSNSNSNSNSEIMEMEESTPTNKQNGGINNEEKLPLNGHVPEIKISTSPARNLESIAHANNMHRRMMDRRMSNSVNALPFLSQPDSMFNIHKSDMKRHASSDAIYIKNKAKHSSHQHGHHHHHDHHLKHPSPMARKDIFYRASLYNIPMYRSDHDLYTKSVCSLHSSVPEDDQPYCCMRCCSPETRASLREMMDCSLMKDPVFLVFGVSNLLTSVGFCVPYAYVPDRAGLKGVDPTNAAFLLAVIGIANMVGRVVFGWIADRPRVNRLMLYNTALVLCGLFTAFSVYCNTYVLMVVYCAGFGLFIGVYVALTPVVLVDLLGLDALTSSFGLTLLFQGIGAIIGPPIAGWIYDMTDSYDPPFIVTGVIVSFSGAMLYGLPCLQRLVQRRKGVSTREKDLGRKVLEERCSADLSVNA